MASSSSVVRSGREQAVVAARAVRPARGEAKQAAALVAPFVIAYLVLFIYPTLKMIELSFTNAPLIGAGRWVGFRNYVRLGQDLLFQESVYHTAYFVALTVVPTTAIALGIALMVLRLRGWLQSLVLACFFLPYILPVTVVTAIWQWVLDLNFGIAQPVLKFLTGSPVAVFQNPVWAMPMVAFVTIWWTNGFNILLFIAGMRNIPGELYEAAALDGAGRMAQFWHITWPLIWPVTALVLTIQLILQLKIFDQVYLLTSGGPYNSTYVVVQYIYKQAFVLDHGGYAATVALFLFGLIAVLSVLQYQVLRTRQT
ncbi:MAG: sugar ABC transporter permease [Acetobacteraceae bacterium]|nr:sugar ABC transporter permease [Acetobacteraceae bacterium]